MEVIYLYISLVLIEYFLATFSSLRFIGFARTLLNIARYFMFLTLVSCNLSNLLLNLVAPPPIRLDFLYVRTHYLQLKIVIYFTCSNTIISLALLYWIGPQVQCKVKVIKADVLDYFLSEERCLYFNH